MFKLRGHIVVLAVLTLIGAAINFPIAFQFIIWQRQAASPQMRLQGPKAAQMKHPRPTPADQPPWPKLDEYSEWRGRFGHLRIDTRSTSGQDTTHNMMVDQYGWPFPVFYDQQMWWPWDDPQWKSAAISDPGIRLDWRGVVLNPVLFAIAVWTIGVTMLLLYRAGRHAEMWHEARAARLKLLCKRCGYPLTPAGTCPECGPGPPRAG